MFEPASASPAPDTPFANHLMYPQRPLHRIRTGLAPALAPGLFITPVPAAEFILNGSFEEGTPAPSATSGQLSVAAGNTANLTGWTASAGIGWYFKASAWGMTAPDGACLFNLYGTSGTYTLPEFRGHRRKQLHGRH